MRFEAGPWTFGDVVLAPFPFTSQAASKKRPAAIVGNEGYNRSRPDVVLMAITSQMRPGMEFGEIWVALWREAGLVKPSAVKPVVATLEQRLIIRKLGQLTVVDQETVRRAIVDILQ